MTKKNSLPLLAKEKQQQIANHILMPFPSNRPKQAYQYPKVPTISLYKLDSPDFLDWGYPARAVMMTPNAKKHLLLSKFKLQLDDQQEYIEPLPLGIKPLDAISDYLGKFHSHVVKEAMK